MHTPHPIIEEVSQEEPRALLRRIWEDSREEEASAWNLEACLGFSHQRRRKGHSQQRERQGNL